MPRAHVVAHVALNHGNAPPLLRERDREGGAAHIPACTAAAGARVALDAHITPHWRARARTHRQ